MCCKMNVPPRWLDTVGGQHVAILLICCINPYKEAYSTEKMEKDVVTLSSQINLSELGEQEHTTRYLSQ